MVSNQNKSVNHHACAMDTYIASSIFYYDDGPRETNVDNLTVNKEEGPQIFNRVDIK